MADGMENNNPQQKKSISVEILNVEFETMKFPFSKEIFYKQSEVDTFLTGVVSGVQRLEKATSELYTFYNNYKNGRVAESNAGPTEVKEETTSDEMATVLKSKGQRMDRLQKHMADLLTNAEVKADEIINDAELDKEKIIREAKAQAEQIISEAQKNADEINRTADERIRQAKEVKYELNKRAREIQDEIASSADKLDVLTEHLGSASVRLRGLAKEASA